MGRVFEGKLVGTDLKIAIVVSRFNSLVTERLLAGAMDTLTRHGVSGEAIDVAWVPGAFDIPVVTKKFAASGSYDAVCCLGAVIRGGTPHFDYVAGQVASGVNRVALDTGVPVSFGVLTTDTVEQALDRAGTKSGNKGAEAALACLESAQLLRAMREL